MKITFIRPNIGRQAHGRYVDEGRMEPLQLGLLAGLTPEHVECALYDDRLEPIPYDEATDLVAITVEVYTARRAYEIAAEYRRRNVRVILGGFHPTLAPAECAAHADSIFIGDAESAWSQIVEDAAADRLQAVYRSSPGVPQAGGVQPRRDLFEGKGYLPITLVQFGRGCRFRCDFCAVSAFFDHTQFVRRTHEVLAEIENQGRRNVFFVDDNFLSDHDAAKRFLRELIPLRLHWVSQATIDMTHDPELMDLLEASGCMGNVIGFESLDPRNLELMGKASNMRRRGWDAYQEQCEILRKHHLQTWAAFTLGHDHDTPRSIRETLDFAMANKFCFAAYNILMPYPGTPLYDRLDREGRLLFEGKWWLHPEYRFNHAAFTPRNMSPDELTEACWDCRRSWNSSRSIFKRLWDFKTHLSSPTRLAAYLGYNPLFARETFKKQGMSLGLFRNVDDRPLRESSVQHEVPLAGGLPAADVERWTRPGRRKTLLYLGLLALLDLLFITVYFGCNWLTSLRAHRWHLHFDWELSIPFVPAMILVYFSILAVFVVPLFALDESGIVLLARRVALATLFAGACWLLLPAELGYPRPHSAPGFQPVYDAMYFTLLPHNLVPSLHVIYSVLILCSAIQVSGTRVSLLLGAWLASICVSVLLVHQHHVADVVGGVAVSYFSYRWVRVKQGETE